MKLGIFFWLLDAYLITKKDQNYTRGYWAVSVSYGCSKLLQQSQRKHNYDRLFFRP
jgi:hypothetical protein